MSDETMMWDEVADIGALLHELDDEAFDRPSLCDGWAVRVATLRQRISA